MTNFIPIFPLNIVVYPSENLNLHIFEPRYKQLIAECFTAKKLFGIPVVVNTKAQEFGTLLEIIELSKVYDTGEMDIKTKGIKVFRMLEQIKEIPEKLYSGAIVSYPENYNNGSSRLMQKIMTNLRELHQILKIEKVFSKPDAELNAFEIAHHIGLSLEEEYELLLLQDELHRQEYLKRHLLKAIPMALRMEQLKEKIKLNGHFKNLSGFDL